MYRDGLTELRSARLGRAGMALKGASLGAGPGTEAEDLGDVGSTGKLCDEAGVSDGTKADRKDLGRLAMFSPLANTLPTHTLVQLSQLISLRRACDAALACPKEFLISTKRVPCMFAVQVNAPVIKYAAAM